MTVPAKQIELWLLGWNETHNGGFKVTFQVGPDDAEYFKGATVKKGHVAGQRYVGYLVEIGADEKPVSPKEVGAKPDSAQNIGHKAKHKFPTGLCGWAVARCEESAFRRWLMEETGTVIDNADVAKRTICSALGISSRKEIDDNPEVAAAFKEQFMLPYAEFRKEHGLEADHF